MALKAFIMIKGKRQCYYTPTRNVKMLRNVKLHLIEIENGK